MKKARKDEQNPTKDKKEKNNKNNEKLPKMLLKYGFENIKMIKIQSV